MKYRTKTTSKRNSQSTGVFGEKLAQLEFKRLGWTMDRVQPQTAIINTPRLDDEHGNIVEKGYIVKHVGDGGIWDYIGFDSQGFWVACEVKEATKNSMPCSRLTKNQRKWADLKLLSVKENYGLPEIYLCVIIVWTDCAPIRIERFTYKPKGSYIRGLGIL